MVPGATELVVLFAVVGLVFGAGKLPELGEALGRTIGEFRTARERRLEESRN